MFPGDSTESGMSFLRLCIGSYSSPGFVHQLAMISDIKEGLNSFALGRRNVSSLAIGLQTAYKLIELHQGRLSIAEGRAVYSPIYIFSFFIYMFNIYILSLSLQSWMMRLRL